MQTPRVLRFLLAGLLVVSLTPVAAQTAQSVDPGESLEFGVSDGGYRQCRAKDFYLADVCLGPPVGNWIVSLAGVLPGGTFPWQASFANETLWLDTSHHPAKNMVSTAFSLSGYTLDQLKLGIPHSATAGVYNDFTIADPDDTRHVVDAQIQVAYSWEALINVLGNYDIELAVTLELEDVTDPTAPVAVGSRELVNRNRQGDQGIELALNLGSSGYDKNDESASYAVKLVRGRTYRIWFKAETAAAPNVLLISAFDAALRARWHQLSVTVDEDDDDLAALLAQHDADIKATLALHDADVKGELALLMDRMAQCEAKLDEIIELLTTPQGQRPGWNQRPKKPKK